MAIPAFLFYHVQQPDFSLNMKTPNLNIGERAESLGVPSADNTSTAIASIAFLLSTSVMLGKETVLLGFDVSSYLGSIAFNAGSLGVQWAAIVSFLSIPAIYIFNNRDFSDFTDHQSYMAYATAFAVVVLTVSPPIRNWIAGSPEFSYIVVGFLTLGHAAISEFGGDALS